jgi:hypothetical protein
MGKVKSHLQDLLDAAEPGPSDTSDNVYKLKLPTPASKAAKAYKGITVFKVLMLLIAAASLLACDPTARIVDCIDGCAAPQFAQVEVLVPTPVACEIPSSLPDSCNIVSENRNKYIIHCDKAE